MQVESDEHIFKFLKSKFGYGLGRYGSYSVFLYSNGNVHAYFI